MGEHSMWEGIGNDYVSLALDRVPSPNKSAKLKAFGTICALSLIHLKHLPSAISPTLFEALCKGWSSVDDPIWLQKFLPSASEVLNVWPVVPSDILPQDPKINEIIINHLNRNVCSIIYLFKYFECPTLIFSQVHSIMNILHLPIKNGQICACK